MDIHGRLPVLSLSLVLALITAFVALGFFSFKNKLSVAALVSAVMAIAIESLSHYFAIFHEDFLLGLAFVFYIYFGSYLILQLIRRIFSEKTVSLDTIAGGVFIYFIIGVVWSMLYRVLSLMDPDGFNASTGFTYFSYATLTTAGYGDIVPVSHFARVLANLEAIHGQMFLTIFIARLVGLYLIQQMSKPAS